MVTLKCVDCGGKAEYRYHVQTPRCTRCLLKRRPDVRPRSESTRRRVRESKRRKRELERLQDAAVFAQKRPVVANAHTLQRLTTEKFIKLIQQPGFEFTGVRRRNG